MSNILNDFSKEKLDQLSEITNIGAGNAATALSHMLGKKIQMSVPKSFVGSLIEIEHILGRENDLVMSVFLKMYGDIDGALLMIFNETDAVKFLNLLNSSDKKILNDFSEQDRSSITEMGNILLGASITALSKFLDLNIQHTIPDHETDMLGSVMDSVLVELGRETDNVLAFRVNLEVVEAKISSDLYYLFDSRSTSKIFEISQKKMSKI